MTLLTTTISPLMTLAVLKSKTIWSACLFHGALNSVVGTSILVLSTASFPWRGILGFGGVMSFGLLCLVLFVVLATDKLERVSST